MTLTDRFRGCLLGLAAGDAVGTTLEFTRRGNFTPIADLVGGGPFGLAPGQWTDDTSMALCLASSLVECQGFDAADQMDRYVQWWREGYLSSTGRFAAVLGIKAGNADELRLALLEAAATHEAQPGVTDEFGVRYVVDSQMQGRQGTATVVSSWIIRRGADYPRLTSGYVR